MGIKSFWQEDVKAVLKAQGVEVDEILQEKYRLLSVTGRNLVVHLVSLTNSYQPDELVALQDRYLANGQNLIHVWEDVWISRKEQVIGRIRSLVGLNIRIHARKTKVINISQVLADEFLEINHVQGTAKSKYRIALSIDDKIVSVACFSNLRKMSRNHPEEYRSAEVIRFASLNGYTVTGGFSKLLKYFILEYKPNDVMSYADRDWSNGKVYEQSGFRLVSVSSPATIYVDRNSLVRYFPHRLPVSSVARPENGSDQVDPKYIKLFNTGNLKYIYYL